MVLPPFFAVSRTFFRVMPDRAKGQLSTVSKGTNEGYSGVTVCPRAFAISNPAPVEPVDG